MSNMSKVDQFANAWTAFIQAADQNYKDRYPKSWAGWKQNQWLILLDQYKMTSADISALPKHIRA